MEMQRSHEHFSWGVQNVEFPFRSSVIYILKGIPRILIRLVDLQAVRFLCGGIVHNIWSLKMSTSSTVRKGREIFSHSTLSLHGWLSR